MIMNPDEKMQEILDKAEEAIKNVQETSNKAIKQFLSYVAMAYVPLIATLIHLEVARSHSITMENADKKYATKEAVKSAFDLQAQNNLRLWATGQKDSAKMEEYNANYMWLVKTLFSQNTREKN